MKVQLVFFDGCPNVEAARQGIREAMRAEGLPADIEEIDTGRPDAPQWALAWGSPTILVDGVDTAGRTAPSGDGASCRLDAGGWRDVAALRARLVDAAGVARRKRMAWSVGAGMLAALGASACCVLPAVLAIVGVSGAGVAASLAPLRPWLLGLAALALGAAFWLAYRRPRATRPECACAVVEPRRRRSYRVALWVGTVATLGLGLYPELASGGSPTPIEVAVGTSEIRLRIEGMTCPACAGQLASILAEVPHVVRARVDYESGMATVVHDGVGDPADGLRKAVAAAGYRALP